MRDDARTIWVPPKEEREGKGRINEFAREQEEGRLILLSWVCRAGGLSYTNPAVTAAPSYYKIAPNNPITFGWNFTGI